VSAQQSIQPSLERSSVVGLAHAIEPEPPPLLLFLLSHQQHTSTHQLHHVAQLPLQLVDAAHTLVRVLQPLPQVRDLLLRLPLLLLEVLHLRRQRLLRLR
jgi:hypothetical protein